MVWVFRRRLACWDNGRMASHFSRYCTGRWVLHTPPHVFFCSGKFRGTFWSVERVMLDYHVRCARPFVHVLHAANADSKLSTPLPANTSELANRALTNTACRIISFKTNIVNWYCRLVIVKDRMERICYFCTCGTSTVKTRRNPPSRFLRQRPKNMIRHHTRGTYCDIQLHSND